MADRALAEPLLAGGSGEAEEAPPAPSSPAPSRTDDEAALTRQLQRDVLRLFAARCLRMLAYGSLTPVLFLFLAECGLSEQQIGWLLSLILFGDLAVTLWLTTRADRFGRRRTLLVGAALKVRGPCAAPRWLAMHAHARRRAR